MHVFWLNVFRSASFFGAILLAHRANESPIITLVVLALGTFALTLANEVGRRETLAILDEHDHKLAAALKLGLKPRLGYRR